MNESQVEYQKVLAEFLEELPAGETGWWFRLPTGGQKDDDTPTMPQDIVLPHFGTVFGLKEESVQIIFHEMGLMTHDS